jgi:phage-related protein
MEYNFWEDENNRPPVEKDIEDLGENDPDSAARVIKKLEMLEKLSFKQLQTSKTIEHIRGKIWTLRYYLKDKICRIYFKVDQYGVMQLVHLVIKKSWKLKPKDITIAETRARTII